MKSKLFVKQILVVSLFFQLLVCSESFACTLDADCPPDSACSDSQCVPTTDTPPVLPISPLQAALGDDPSCPLPADIIVKLDGVEESIFDRGATTETLPTGVCPYLNPLPAEPANIRRNVSVFDLNGDYPQCQCDPSVRNLIYAYYDGDPSSSSEAGAQLCNSDLTPPEELGNCPVLVARDEIFHAGLENNLVKKSHVKNAKRNNTVSKNLDKNKKSSDSGLLKDLKSQTLSFDSFSFSSLTSWLGLGILTVLSPIVDFIDRQTYDTQPYTPLTVEESNRLSKSWPRDTTKYYAATRQHWFAYAGFFPQDIRIMYPNRMPGGNRVEVHYFNRADLLASTISPTQALADFRNAAINQTNFWPDFRDIDAPPVAEDQATGGTNGSSFGRRTAGSLNYEFQARNANRNQISNTRYKPYYHANFIDPFPLFLFAKLIDSNNNLFDAFSNIYINWYQYRRRAMQFPPWPRNQPVPPAGFVHFVFPPFQEPNDSPWGVPPMPNPAPQPQHMHRLAIIIQGARRGEIEEFFFRNTSAYIEYIFRERLNYPAENFAIYNLSGQVVRNAAEFKEKINATLETARTIRANDPNPRIELIIYLWGHGRSVNPEPVKDGQQPIDRAWFKDGGLEHEFWLGGNNSLLESTLKDFANDPEVRRIFFNVVNGGRVDFVDGSCESGAGIY